MSAVRENILDAVVSIPKAVEKALVLNNLYETSSELQDEVSHLYLSILDASTIMLDWLAKISTRDKIKAAVQVMLKQHNYEADLTVALIHVDKCALSVMDRASLCAQISLRRMEDNDTSRTICPSARVLAQALIGHRLSDTR